MKPRGLARRILPVFYVLDTSGSMRGYAVECLNSAMEETVRTLKNMAAHNGDVQIRIAVLSFDNEARWMDPGVPVDVEDFVWEPLTAELGNQTCMGAAVRELNSKLSEDAFLCSLTGSLMPVIVFMTDGFASDGYEAALEDALRNHLFRDATRVGFAVGSSADVKMIARLTGNSRAVVRAGDLDTFVSLIKLVSETATQAASLSHVGDVGDRGGKAVEDAMIANDDEVTEWIASEDVHRGKVPIWDMNDPI